MLNTDSPPPWRGIVIYSNGQIINVSHYNITPHDLIDLFYAALEKIPHAAKAMELALEKHNNNNKHM